MPRHPRLFVPGATYLVYCRVARGEFVFDDPLEAEAFVSAVREVRDLHEDLISLFELHSEYTIEDLRSTLHRQRQVQARRPGSGGQQVAHRFYELRFGRKGSFY